MIVYFDKAKFQELLKHMNESALSDFYRKKYQDIVHENPDDPEKMLSELPFLTREDIAGTPPDERLYLPKTDVSFVAYTSGTTSGAPLVLYWSSVDDYYYQPSLDTEARTLLITHPALNKNFGHTFIQQCRQAKDPVTPVFADYQNLAQSAILANETKADAIYATPTIALMLADHIDTYYDAKRIKLIVVFSESLTELKRAELSERYPDAVIANVYGSTEIGQLLFYPCQHIMKEKKNAFHILTSALVALELEAGELVLTQGQNKAFPLIRYKTGDFFEVNKDKCACGIETPTLSWSGRMDVDKIRVNGVEVRSENIESALRSCKASIGNDYQLHFYSQSSEKTAGGAIRIVMEIASPAENAADETAKNIVAGMVREELLAHWHISQSANLQTAVDRGLFLVPEIVFVKELSVKTQKARRLINHIL